MLSVFMLSDVMLSVSITSDVMLSVGMPSVVEPYKVDFNIHQTSYDNGVTW